MNHVPQTKQYVCPCCRGFIGEAAPIDKVTATLSGFNKIILSELAKEVGRNVSRGEILQAMYGADRDGGPDYAQNVVSIYIHRLRKILPAYGWSIVSSQRAGANTGDGGLYRLTPAEVTP